MASAPGMTCATPTDVCGRSKWDRNRGQRSWRRALSGPWDFIRLRSITCLSGGFAAGRVPGSRRAPDPPSARAAGQRRRLVVAPEPVRWDATLSRSAGPQRHDEQLRPQTGRQRRVASRSLASEDGREVAAAGIVRVAITPEEFVRRLTDIASFKKGDAVLQIGTFSAPPDITDVAGLTLPSADVRNLRSCRVGDCGMQLPSYIIDRMRRVSRPGEFGYARVADVPRPSPSPDDCADVCAHRVRRPVLVEGESSAERGGPRHPSGDCTSAEHLALCVRCRVATVWESLFRCVARCDDRASRSDEPSIGVRGIREPVESRCVWRAVRGITRRIVRSRARGALADFLEGLPRRLETGGSPE